MISSNYPITTNLYRREEHRVSTTPVLAAALTAETDKPFLYEVYPTDYGLHVRITIGLSEVGDACKSLTGNVNCADSILSRQVIVRYEP